MERHEVQRLVCQYGMEYTGRILNMKASEFRKFCDLKGVKAPVNYVKDMNRLDLVDVILVCGSYRDAAVKLGVSEAFLRKRFEVTPLPIDGARLESLLTELGSPKLVATAMNRKVTEVVAYIKEHNLEKPDHTQIDSKMEYSFGRRAEIDFLFLRGNAKDMTKDDPTHPFDALDQEYGRVNVKASSMFTYKAKGKTKPVFWKFSLSGADTCDAFAFMCYEENKLLSAYLVKKEEVELVRVKGKDNKTFIINLHNLELLKKYRIR